VECSFRRHPRRNSQLESIIFGECTERERDTEWEFFEAKFAARKAEEDDVEWKEGVKDRLRFYVSGFTEHGFS
jgi:hypothetical protein